MMKSYYKQKEDDSWKNFKEQLDYLKYSVDAHYLLENLGVKAERETPKEIRSSCPIHAGDNRTAFRFNKQTHTWVCFTHKCHDTFGNDTIGLIRGLLGLDFMGAVAYLKQLVGDISGVDFIESKRKREINSFMQSYSSITMRPDSVNEASLEKFKGYRSSFFNSDGFKNETLDYFEIAGGWKDKQDLIRDIIPIRAETGELLAYSLRDIRKDVEADDKYILTPGFDKQNCLYNLDKVVDMADKVPIIVVEGFKSVWRLYDYGIKNVVATMGSSITEGQQFLLYMYALKGVVVMFDNDIAGVSGITKALEDMSSKVDILPVFIQEVDENGNGLDPADLTKEQVHEYLDTYFIKGEV